MDDEIKDATEYIYSHAIDPEVPRDALRRIIAERVAMAMSATARQGAVNLQIFASKIRAKQE